MSFAGWALAVAVVSAGAAASQQHQAAKSQEHQKDRSATRSKELSDQAASETAAAKAGAKRDKAKRQTGYERNLNLFSSDPSSMAGQARKTLTGQ